MYESEKIVANDDSAKKITFPRITKVAFENFDLYSRQPNAVARIEKNVFCLIGANGLGKSTFLNTVNFIVTGAVPDPLRRFQSAHDYYREAARIDRTEDYFSGRISEGSRSIVKATVELTWPSAIVEVTREIFGGLAVSQLVITDTKTHTVTVKSLNNGDDGEQLRALYESEVLRLCGLEEFAQFVFLIHFVATFDEGRHLLTWDDAALTNALYLAFGTDPAAAKAADKLKHDMNRESSRGRNVRFSARHVADRIKDLMNVLKGTESEDLATEEQLKARYDALVSQHEQAEERVRNKHNELREADLRWTDLSAALTEAQLEYRKAFSARLQKTSTVEHHPIIRSSLSENRCAICGTENRVAILKAKLAKNECPLCDSPVEASAPDTEAVAYLRKLDEKIISIRDDLASILRMRERLAAEVSAAEAAESAAHSALQVFENEEAVSLAKLESGVSFSAIRKEIERLEKERSGFLTQSQAHYKKRDELREKLRSYEKELKKRYEIGAREFVPRFRELAEEFIGFPIDVYLEHQEGANEAGFGLRLRMNDQLRSRPDKLSESQRFFVDIALRMALAEFMSSSPATLLIDTPEGSLDIAYEARAGSMFSRFVSEGNAVLMTANLRSSQLVFRLAQQQHREGMQVVRMTDWTDLSEVQQSEEALFVRAYEAIDAALL